MILHGLQYLFIEFLADFLCPAEVEVTFLAGPIDVSHLDDHVTDHEAVRLHSPVYAWSVIIIHLDTPHRHMRGTAKQSKGVSLAQNGDLFFVFFCCYLYQKHLPLMYDT